MLAPELLPPVRASVSSGSTLKQDSFARQRSACITPHSNQRFRLKQATVILCRDAIRNDVCPLFDHADSRIFRRLAVAAELRTTAGLAVPESGRKHGGAPHPPGRPVCPESHCVGPP